MMIIHVSIQIHYWCVTLSVLWVKCEVKVGPFTLFHQQLACDRFIIAGLIVVHW